MRSRFSRSRRPQVRLGFTLLELLVAILLIDVAILGFVHTHAIVVRSRNDMRARAAAVNASTSRVEQMLASPCAAAAGSTVRPAFAEFWSSRLDATTREISDSVAFGPSKAHAIVLRTRISC